MNQWVFKSYLSIFNKFNSLKFPVLRDEKIYFKKKTLNFR
jgi:hypothetical protein